MPKSFFKNLSAIAVLLLLPACFGGGEKVANDENSPDENSPAEVAEVKKEVPQIFYISEKASECEGFFFTCPEGRFVFNNEKGCGCTADASAADSEQPGLGDMIRESLAKNLIEPKCDGGVLAEFAYIDEGATDSGNSNYDVWAIARELCPDGTDGATFDGPVAFEIEKTEFSRVVRDYTAVSAKNSSAVKKAFTSKAAEWVLAAKNDARDQVVAELKNNLERRLGVLQQQIAVQKAAELAAAEAAAAAAAENSDIENENSGDSSATESTGN